MIMSAHEEWIKLCLEASYKTMHLVHPNPMVGAAVVLEQKLLSLGIHERYGDAHAEVNAINGVANKSDLERATLYVTLEPCNHQGKTPPCTELIIQSGIKKVVVATRDPNPKVAGSGIAALEAKGVEVIEDVMRDEARRLNRRFFTYHMQKRPYIILKWAETRDGFIGKSKAGSVPISSEQSRTVVHKWRSQEQAIMVGTRTALIDNPELTVRHAEGRNPLRIVIDKDNTLPSTLKLWNGQAPTLCFTYSMRPAHDHEEVIELNRQEEPFKQILNVLYKRHIISLLVEGGAETLRRIMEISLWDEARIFRSPNDLKEGVKAPTLRNAKFSDHPLLTDVNTVIGGDSLRIHYNSRIEPIFFG